MQDQTATNNYAQLSENELDSIINTLKDVKSEQEAKSINTAKSLTENNNSEELLEEKANVVINQATGIPEALLCEEQNEVNINKDISLADINVEDDSFKQAALNTGKESNISDAAAYQLLDLMLKIKQGEHISGLYAKLPDEIKTSVDSVYNPECGVTKNQLAEIILHEFISQTALEKEIIDFQTAMQNTLDIPEILDMYTEHIKDVMEVKILESATRLEEGGETEKASMLRKVSSAFTDSYTHKSLREFLSSNRKARNRITKDLTDYNTFCRNFNFLNSNSRFAINDICQIAPVLNRVLDDDSITTDDIEKFVILFCKQCATFDPNGVVDAAYMYYFIKNIVTLDYIEELKTDFSKEILDNVKETIYDIKKYETANNERLETIKNNKKTK